MATPRDLFLSHDDGKPEVISEHRAEAVPQHGGPTRLKMWIINETSGKTTPGLETNTFGQSFSSHRQWAVEKTQGLTQDLPLLDPRRPQSIIS